MVRLNVGNGLRGVRSVTTKPASVNDPGELRGIFENADALLLDFDGPLCSVFAGLPAPVVADQLRVVLANGGRTNLPIEVAETDDPFDVFRFAASLSHEDARYVEAALRAHESEAVRTAVPTLGAHEFVRMWHSPERKLAVVSNNSAVAVGGYLDLHSLNRHVDANCSRNSSDPALLKPSPFLLEQASVELGVKPSKCVMVGDSTSDIDAAKAAGVFAVGYANKPAKVDELASKSHAVTQSITLLLEVLSGLEFEDGR